jgi:glycosyltransferase involved in cell wall biosynthesis
MRVVIYEPDHRGHHFVFLSHVLPEISDLAGDVTLATTPTAARSEQFQLHLGSIADRFVVDTSIGEKSPASGLNLSWQRFKQLRNVARRLRPDHLYVPYGEGIVQAVGLAALAGRRPWSRATEAEVLLMRGGYQYPVENFRRRILNRVGPRTIALGSWTRVHHLNPDDLAVLKRYDSNGPGRFRLMPDPVEPPSGATKSELRRRLGIPEAGRYVGCAGGIDRRKGMHLLIRAFLECRSQLRPDDRLLLAGPIEPEIRTILEQEAADALAAGQISLIDRPLTATEVGLALEAMNLVVTPYPAHAHSASVVIRAAAGGVPVLGSAIGWMQRTIREFQLGATCSVRDRDAFRAELLRGLEGSEAFQLTAAAQRFVTYHGVANFRAHWNMRLRQRLNLPADENFLPWEFVLNGEAAEIVPQPRGGGS